MYSVPLLRALQVAEQQQCANSLSHYQAELEQLLAQKQDLGRILEEKEALAVQVAGLERDLQRAEQQVARAQQLQVKKNQLQVRFVASVLLMKTENCKVYIISRGFQLFCWGH
jgi:chorismate-pyruvate lyase